MRRLIGTAWQKIGSVPQTPAGHACPGLLARVSRILCRSLHVSAGDSMSPSEPPNLLRYKAFPRSVAAGISSVPGRWKIFKGKNSQFKSFPNVTHTDRNWEEEEGTQNLK